jgi:predicted dienelactone hydrolase
VGVVERLFTKTSETTSAARPLNTVIWYPTDEQGEIDDYLGGIPDAALAPEARGLPLLMFSHGSCGFPAQSPFFTAHFASYGFIVAAPPHPGNVGGVDPACAAVASLVDSFANRAADISFVIDSLLALNGDSESMFFESIDAERIGMSGHSFGGMTSFRVAALDARVSAAVPMAPAVKFLNTVVIQAELDMLAANPKPIMIQGGELDTTTPFPDNQQLPYDELNAPRFLLKILDADHLAFFRICGRHAPNCTDHQFILRYAAPFLLSYVAGDNQFAAYLDVAVTPTGVEYTADP